MVAADTRECRAVLGRPLTAAARQPFARAREILIWRVTLLEYANDSRALAV